MAYQFLNVNGKLYLLLLLLLFGETRFARTDSADTVDIFLFPLCSGLYVCIYFEILLGFFSRKGVFLSNDFFSYHCRISYVDFVISFLSLLLCCIRSDFREISILGLTNCVVNCENPFVSGSLPMLHRKVCVISADMECNFLT